jgi:hypothetical protein
MEVNWPSDRKALLVDGAGRRDALRGWLEVKGFMKADEGSVSLDATYINISRTGHGTSLLTTYKDGCPRSCLVNGYGLACQEAVDCITLPRILVPEVHGRSGGFSSLGPALWKNLDHDQAVSDKPSSSSRQSRIGTSVSP